MANEHGFVMVMALMMLVVLSLMATAAMSVRNTEQAIVRNTEVMVTNFFGVEAVTLEGASMLEGTNNDNLRDIDTIDCNNDPNTAGVPPSNLCWLRPNAAGAIDLSFNAQWPTGGAGGIVPHVTTFNGGNRSITPAGYAPDGTVNGDRIWYAAVQGNLAADADQYEICRGSNLSDPVKMEKCYSVHGMYDVKPAAGKAFTGRRMMMVGYKKTVYN